MDLGLNNKVALVGGSSRGLGLGCAVQLAREGVHVILCARGKKNLNIAKEKIEQKSNVQIVTLQGDLSNAHENEKIVNLALKKFGRIDILVNNIGGPKPGSFFEIDNTDWLDAYNLILASNVQMCRLIIPHMKMNKWGRIVNITSMVVKEPADSLILSNVFRVGIVALTRTLARELIADNITINNVCPGAFKTSRAIKLMEMKSQNTKKSIEEIEIEIVNNLPLGRFHKPRELGNLVTYLASEQAQGLTGTTISFDGGKQKSLF